MPLTTTSGYTFPVAGVPTAQNPAQGSPAGSSGNETTNDQKQNYSSWNGDWMGYLQYMAEHGDASAMDKLFNYFMSENSAQIAREWTEKREDSAYQRLVKDMRAAGFNPYALATMGGNPIASGSSGNNYSGSYSASYQINKEKNAQNWLKVALSAMLPIIGALIAGAL